MSNHHVPCTGGKWMARLGGTTDAVCTICNADMTMHPVAVIWDTQLPSQPGFYWYQSNDATMHTLGQRRRGRMMNHPPPFIRYRQVVVLRVDWDEAGDRFLVGTGSGERYDVRTLAGKWAGPIAQPVALNSLKGIQ